MQNQRTSFSYPIIHILPNLIKFEDETENQSVSTSAPQKKDQVQNKTKSEMQNDLYSKWLETARRRVTESRTRYAYFQNKRWLQYLKKNCKVTTESNSQSPESESSSPSCSKSEENGDQQWTGNIIFFLSVNFSKFFSFSECFFFSGCFPFFGCFSFSGFFPSCL